MNKLNLFVALIVTSFGIQFSFTQPGFYEVNAGAFYYSPNTLEIEVGSTVTWTNVGGLHNVNFQTNSITGTDFENPESFELQAVYSNSETPTLIGSWTFNVEGTYTYDCSIGSHASQGMIGTIIVTPEGEYPGCMDSSACNYLDYANIDDGSCLYNNLCCDNVLDVECNACNACQTPEEWCLNNPGFDGCDAYDVVGCMDDGLQSWSPFPGNAADNYAEGANTQCENCCAYWGCGNPDNTLMLVGTFMDLSGENGWNGTSMTVFNIWEDSQIYDIMDTVFYFSPTFEIMYELPPVITEIGDLDGDGYDDADCCGLIDESEFLDDGSINPNFGGPLPDGQVNHDDCLECPLNDDFVGELGYVVNFCAPDDLLNGCYQIVVDEGDPQQVAWEIQNADISVFALSGSSYFDSTSGAACSNSETFGFSDVKFTSNSVNFDQDTGLLSFGVTNSGTETTVNSEGIETAGTTWILIDGFAEVSDSPSNITGFSEILNEYVTSDGYYLGTNYEFTYDISEFTSVNNIGPGDHSITIWLNGGSSQPLGVNPEFGEENFENNYTTIQFNIPEIFGCLDPWASNYNPNANSDNNGNEECLYVCGDTDGDGIVDNENYQYYNISVDGGNFQAEVGWTIQTIDGFEYLSGGAPYNSNDFSEFGLCLAPDCYEIVMTDNFGDGWNGNTIEIGNEIEFTLETGTSGTALFEVGGGSCGEFIGCTDSNATNYNENAIQSDGSCLYDCSSFTDSNGNSYESLEINLDGGIFQGEISWEIFDSNNVLVLEGQAPFNDVTCLPQGCYTVSMQDSFGDGWNGNVLTLESGSGYTWNFVGPTNDNALVENIAIGEPSQCGIFFGCTDEQADNYDEINNVDDGTCTYSCLDGGTAVTISCDGGSWQSEVGWTIFDENGIIIISGGAPFVEEGVCLVDGCYTVEMTDSFGDGWSGNELSIIGDGINLEFEATGSSETAPFGINNDECVTLGCTDVEAENYNSDANFDDGSCNYDCDSWLDTSELYSCYYYVWVLDYSVDYMEGLGYDCTCVIEPTPGCTDPNADNYDDLANQNDGSCIYTCDEEDGEFPTLITCDGGTWQNEVSWQIYDELGNLVASGGAPYSNEVCLLDNVCYTIEMQDSYGDGWNGNTLDFGGTSISLYAGSNGNDSYNCSSECNFVEIPVSVVNGQGTSFGFSITNSENDIVVSGGNNFSGFLCLDPNDCYDINLASANGGGNQGATLVVGEDEFGWNGFSSWYAYIYQAVGGSCPVYGCTDTTADNYDENATINESAPNDSSNPCLYYGCTDANASNFDSDANFEDGSCVYLCESGLDSYYISCDGGSLQYQISWQIIDSEANIVAEGDAPDNTGVCLEPGCYTINMFDTGGDGWNGNSLIVGDMTFELNDGYESVATFAAGVDAEDCGIFFGCTDPDAVNFDPSSNVDDNSCFYPCAELGWESVLIETSSGTYPYEIAWNLEDENGEIIFSAGELSGGTDFSNPGIVDSWLCLDPNGCYTLNMSDTYGDGWNGASITIISQDGNENDISLFAGFSGSTQYGTCIFECDFDTYDVTVNNGFGTDFGFIISDIDGNSVVSGGNNFSGLGCLDLENGCYTISLSSSNGGGFGSASLAIGDYEFDSNDGTGGYWSSVITNGLGHG